MSQFQRKVDTELESLDRVEKFLSEIDDSKIYKYRLCETDGPLYIPLKEEFSRRTALFRHFVDKAKAEMAEREESVVDAEEIPRVTIGGEFVPEIACVGDPLEMKKWAQANVKVEEVIAPIGQPEGSYVKISNLPPYWLVGSFQGPYTIACVRTELLCANIPATVSEDELRSSSLHDEPNLIQVVRWYERLGWIERFDEYRTLMDQVVRNKKYQVGARVDGLGNTCRCEVYCETAES